MYLHFITFESINSGIFFFFSSNKQNQSDVTPALIYKSLSKSNSNITQLQRCKDSSPVSDSDSSQLLQSHV